MRSTNASMPPAVLTVEEAAAELRIGRTTAYDLVKRGQLPTVRLGRQIRIPRAALDRMLAGHEGPRG